MTTNTPKKPRDKTDEQRFKVVPRPNKNEPNDADTTSVAGAALTPGLELIEAPAERPLIMTPPEVWRPLFLKGLRDSGNVRAACQYAGVFTAVAYRARANDAEFAVQWLDAMVDAVDLLRAVAWKRAIGGQSDYLLWKLLAAHDPDLRALALAERTRNPSDETPVGDTVQIVISLPDNGRGDCTAQFEVNEANVIEGETVE